MKIIAYESAHLDEIDDPTRPFLGMVRELKYEDRGPAFTGMRGGRIVACAGIVEMTQYRAYAWGVFPKQRVAQHLVAVHRAVSRFLAEQRYKRIDAHVAMNDAAGHRWARMLGFEREVFCRPWAMPDGSAISEYVRWG